MVIVDAQLVVPAVSVLFSDEALFEGAGDSSAGGFGASGGVFSVEALLDGVDDASAGGLGAGGGVFSVGTCVTLFNSSVSPDISRLNSLIPLPMPRATSGSRFEPNTRKTTSKMMSISHVPTFGNIPVPFPVILYGVCARCDIRLKEYRTLGPTDERSKAFPEAA